MLTLPTGFQAELEAETSRGVVVYELELAAGTLRYSSQALTWDGNAYAALAVEQSPIVKDKGRLIPSCRVTFSNVANTLRPHIEPDDLITNKRMRVRLLMRDSSDVFLAGSVTLLYGTMERPQRVDENAFEITVVGLGAGPLGVIPPRSTSLWCGVHKFADGVDCNYTQSALTTNSGTGLTIAVDDAQPFQDELDRLPSGADIRISIGADTNLKLNSASVGGGTVTIAAPPITWATSEVVKFDSCDREFSACEARARTFEFQGFRGVESYLRAGTPRPPIEHPDWIIDIIYPNNTFERTLDVPPRPLSDTQRPVPIIFGRRLTRGQVIEEITFRYPTSLLLMKLRTSIVSEGEIDAVNCYEIDGFKGKERIGASIKIVGTYFRPGAIGVDDDETEAEYISDPNTRERSQNRDLYSAINSPYSRTAYVTLLQPVIPEDADTDFVELTNELYDVSGILCQKYTSAATPTTDGAPVFSANPVWQVVNLLTNPRYGLGRIVTVNDLDFTVIKPQADYCDVVIDGAVATVSSVEGVNDKRYVVDTVKDLGRFMTVEYDGPLHPTESDTIERVIAPNKIKLATGRSDAASGDTITAKLPRYESHVIITSQTRADIAIEEILKTCNGYITYNVDGKIQIRVEQTESSQATFADVSPTQGYGIVEDSWNWLTPDAIRDPDVNRVHVVFRDADNTPSEATGHRFDHIENFGAHPLVINAEGIRNRDQAHRRAVLEVAKHRDLGNGAEWMVGPIGMALQPGDRIAVTHSQPGWTAEDRRVVSTETIGLGSTEEFLVRVRTEGYDATIYNDDPPPRTDPGNTNTPDVTLTIDSETRGSIILNWTTGASLLPLMFVNIWKSTSTFGSDPEDTISPEFRVATIRRTHADFGKRFEYTPTDDEIGTTLYFIATVHLFNFGVLFSNEVTSVPATADPTDSVGPFYNLVRGGDFEDPLLWTLTAGGGSVTDVLAEGNEAGTNWTNLANAHDASEVTYAEVNIPVGGGATEDVEWNWTTSGTKTGNVYITASIVANSNPFALGDASMLFHYSTDDGSTWIPFGSQSRFSKTTHRSAQLTSVDMTMLRVRARAQGGGAFDWDYRNFEVKFEENTLTAPYALIQNNVLILEGDGTNYAKARRPFPGLDPPDNQLIISNGGSYISVFKFKSPSTPSHAVELVLVDDQTGTEYELLSLAASNVATSWKAVSDQFIASSEILGSIYVELRTKSTVAVTLDDLGVYLGERVPDEHWGHIDELRVSYHGDRSTGRIDGFPAGRWAVTGQRISTVSGESQ